MSTTPPEAPAPDQEQQAQPGPQSAGPRTSRDELRDLGRIRRTVGPERKVAGVAGGLARHLDVDPIILRVAFVVLVFFGGSGLLLYGACWLLLPEDGQPSAPLSLDDRSRSVALLVVGAVSLLLLLGDSVGQFSFPWPLVVVAAIALVALTFLDRDKPGRQRPRPTAPPVPHRHDPVSQQYVPAQPGWVPPPTYVAPLRPRNPRKRGPVLFWFTLFLSAVLVAGLGVLDLAGVPVTDAAYPATVAGTAGVMLLLSAFWGRGGGLVLTGLLAAVAMGATAVPGQLEGDDIQRTPVSAADVPDHLSTGIGEVVLDLTEVEDPAALDGRVLTQDVRVGHIEVIVPDGWGVDYRAEITGVGNVSTEGNDSGGFGVTRAGGWAADPGQPTITVDAEMRVGAIEIRTQSERYGR
jgi:phage shock protein PspC (stress-responsive transcriptional regulator)